MSKSNATRMEETLEYLRRLSPHLSQHLYRVLMSSSIARPVFDEVGEAISLSGKTPWFGGDRANNTDTQRDALRALLLCQRVYLCNLWAPGRLKTPKPQTSTYYKTGWPKITIDYWRFDDGASLSSPRGFDRAPFLRALDSSPLGPILSSLEVTVHTTRCRTASTRR